MPKLKFKNFKKRLPLVPEQNLTPEQLAAYQDLLAQVQENHLEEHVPLEPLIQAAKQKARIEMLERIANRMGDDVVDEMGTGRSKVHCVLEHILKVESSYLTCLGKIGLTATAKATLKARGVRGNDTMGGFAQALADLEND
jgi:hypothetical protein